MRLFEFADAESQMELWKLITDSVWQAIYKQSQEQKQLDAQKAKTTSAAPKQAKPFKPKIVSPQSSKTKKTSAQAIQQQKVQSNAVKSKPKTTSMPSNSATASVGKNQSNSFDLPPPCRTKVMEQSPLISENSGYETIQIYR